MRESSVRRVSAGRLTEELLKKDLVKRIVPSAIHLSGVVLSAIRLAVLRCACVHFPAPGVTVQEPRYDNSTASQSGSSTCHAPVNAERLRGSSSHRRPTRTSCTAMAARSSASPMHRRRKDSGIRQPPLHGYTRGILPLREMEGCGALAHVLCRSEIGSGDRTSGRTNSF